jgi:hypothetical protein
MTKPISNQYIARSTYNDHAFNSYLIDGCFEEL